MKIAIIVVRSLLGLMFIFASAVFLFKIPMEQPPVTGNALTFMTGLMASGYLMTLVKVLELVCGILLIINFWAPLAAVILFPISLNIVLFHAFLDDPKNIPSALFVILANLFLAYAYRKNYAGLWAAKPLT